MSTFVDPDEYDFDPDAKEVPPGDDTPDEQITEQDDPDTTVPAGSDRALCECEACGKPTFHYRGPAKEFHGKLRSKLLKMLAEGVTYGVDAVPGDVNVDLHVDVRQVVSRLYVWGEGA